MAGLQIKMGNSGRNRVLIHLGEGNGFSFGLVEIRNVCNVLEVLEGSWMYAGGANVRQFCKGDFGLCISNTKSTFQQDR